MFTCTHTRTTTPREDEEGSYERCLDCGARLPWEWPDDFVIKPPKVGVEREA